MKLDPAVIHDDSSSLDCGSSRPLTIISFKMSPTDINIGQFLSLNRKGHPADPRMAFAVDISSWSVGISNTSIYDTNAPTCQLLTYFACFSNMSSEGGIYMQNSVSIPKMFLGAVIFIAMGYSLMLGVIHIILAIAGS